MIHYDSNDWLHNRFISHFSFGTTSDISAYQSENVQPNIIEKAGNVGLWMLENLPRKVWEAAKDPRVLTIALTALALFTITLTFYPVVTFLAVKDIVVLIFTNTPFWAIKFAIYIGLVETTIACALRAYGRFCNKALMDNFYQKAQTQVQTTPVQTTQVSTTQVNKQE